jgi:hypothetical protein
VNLTIAAADTADKSTANYICDGVADEVEINAAIGDMAGGGTITLLAGTYNINAPIVISIDNLDNGITIRGVGDTTILTLPNGHATDMPMIWAWGRSGNKLQDVVFRDFKIDGNSASVTGQYQGILLTETSNITIHDVTIEDGKGADSGYGFFSQGETSGLLIEDCAIGTWGINGMELRYASGVVQNNIFANSRLELYSSSHDLSFTGNTFTESWIDCGTDDGVHRISNLSFTGNNMTRAGTGVMAVARTDGLTITGNTFDCDLPAISQTDNTNVTISGNTQL